MLAHAVKLKNLLKAMQILRSEFACEHFYSQKYGISYAPSQR